jgi:hypothetical protein
MLVASLVVLTAVAELPTITIEQTVKGYVAKAGTFDARQQAEIDAEFARQAAEICKGSDIRWGEFSSIAKLGKNPVSEPAPVAGYTHEFRCVPVDQTNYAPAPADWQPSTADQADARRIFETYYAHRDAGEFAAALAMFAPDVISNSENWGAEMRGTNKKLGSGKRRITAITWYVNPEGAPHPGIYAAIDFVGEFPNTYVYCGYIALYRRGAGSYAITREEQNIFSHGDGSADPTQVAQMRASMCRE